MARRVKAEIITIGDEVLRGEIVDSNKALLAERLLSLDIECHYQSSVRDDRGKYVSGRASAVVAGRDRHHPAGGGLGDGLGDRRTNGIQLHRRSARPMPLHKNAPSRIPAALRRS